MADGRINAGGNGNNYWQTFRDDITYVAVKQIDKELFTAKVIDIRPVYVPPGRTPSKVQIEEVSKGCIEKLSDANLFVTQERVEKMVCQQFSCQRLQNIRISFVDQIICVSDLNRLVSKINAYIIAFLKTRSICTLFELREAVTEFAPNKDDFNSLKVGPLQRFPVVYQQFRFPPDQAEIPEITSMQILDHFNNYLTKNNLWVNSKLNMESFMMYLVQEYGADNAYQLGVRVRSLPLAIGMLKKAKRDCGQNHREIKAHFQESLKTEIGEAFRKFQTTILQTGDGVGMEIRKHYLKVRPEVAIMEVFEKFNALLMIIQADRGLMNISRLERTIYDFLTLLQGDEMGRNILHLAICMSNTAVEESALALLVSSDSDSDDDNDDVGGHIHHPPARHKPPPRKDKLIGSLKTYIDRCLNAGSLSLTHLDRIEEKLLDDFAFPAFSSMGYGRFLEFLMSEMKQILEESGGMLLGSASSEGDSSFKPHQTDILEFIKQCRQCEHSLPEQIETALCKQYRVKEVHHLGYGNITRLLSYADKHGRHMFGDFTVFYESSLVQFTGLVSGCNTKVGVMGHQTRDAARICLHNCPLLENLSSWSQWGLVFEPEHGKLKDFVQKYGGVTTATLEGGKYATLDFLAMEVKPEELIKIVSTTSPECVATALENRDVQTTTGHLVSMAIAYKGVQSMPLALLSGHMKSALLQMHAGEATSDSAERPASPSLQHTAAMFVLQCLLRIPTKICISLANQLFLEPLGHVVGSSMSKQLLVQLCKTVPELDQLIELGCLLGVQVWTDMIQQKCRFLDSSVQTLLPEVEEFLETEKQEEDEECYELLDESDAEDVDKILAGDVDGDNVIVTSDTDTKPTINADNAEDTERDGSLIEISDTDDDLILMDELCQDESFEEIINQIRRDEFGVGVQLSADGQRLMKVQQERLGRSLDRLSKDLYSKDTHFVLELIQNADDNNYHNNLLNIASDECPAVKFVIDNDGIYVLNNELGFREQDIRALCDVGRSTKGKHKFGYIGQKGIGFKSVFRVTDCPEVHSNGYHIKFDVTSGPTGYIMPHWIPEQDRMLQSSEEGWTTHIILRLKADLRLQTRTLAARFNDIHPSLLLFLHRLRQITLENKIEKTEQMMRRRDVGDNIVEIQHSHGCDRYLVIKKVLDASKISLQAKSGTDVESTEIALAFPLKQQGQDLSLQTMPPKQPVFAFLPLRSYGFRFIVQGDFDVPSSREDVDRDSSWNQWLRNEIHTVFIESFDIFKTHPELNCMEAVCTFLQFVPMEDEVLDFFKPVASDILKKLKAKPCVPTQPNSEGVVIWKMPSQTVRVRDPLVRSVITSELLLAHLNMSYLHSDVATMLNPTLTSCLGIETLTSEHLYQLGKALIVNMGPACSNTQDVVLIAKWMACIYRSLDEFHHDDTVLTTLKSQRLLPLSDGELVSLLDKIVFYPMPASTVKREKGNDPRYYLQRDIQSLHPMLLNTGDEEVNSQVHKLLMRLGIKQLSPFDVINHHIIPVLKSQNYQSKSKETLISYVVYIKEETDKDPSVCNMDEIKDITMVMTNRGFKNPSREPVQFSPLYGNKINLEKLFSGYDWTLIHPCYLPYSSTQPVVNSWHEFFSKLGVEEFFSIRQKDVHLMKEDLATSLWCTESLLWPKAELEFIVQDYGSAELEGLITNNKHPPGELYTSQMSNLCMYLDTTWESKCSKYCVTHVLDKDENRLKETSTSFSILLKTARWLPASETETKQDGNGLVSREVRIVLREPSSLYMRSDVVQNLLADKVLYVNVKLSGGSFSQFLGIKNVVTIETVKEQLLKWSERKKEDSPTVFCTSLAHMKNVYYYLGTELRRQDFRDLLREKPVFFVPDITVRNSVNLEDVKPGKMLNRNEIWLSDNTGLFNKHRSLLEEFHSDISHKRTIAEFYSDRFEVIELFRQEGMLDVQPKVEDYITLLCLLCSTNTPKQAEIMSDVLCIFSTIGQALVAPPEGMPGGQTVMMAVEALKAFVRTKLQRQKVFPTKKQIWVCLEDHPVISDNKEWEKMFTDKPGVHFLDMEDKTGKSKGRGGLTPRSQRNKVTESGIQTDMIDVVIEVCGMKRLSEVVDIRPTPDMIQLCQPLHAYVHQIVPTIQLYLMARFEDVYQHLEQTKTKEMLADARFYQTGKLEVSYWLNNMTEDTFVIRQEKCVIHPPAFYFHRDHLNSTSEINREVARYFSSGNLDCNNLLRSFLSELSNIISGATDDTADALLQRHDADGMAIPEDEKWEVEAPVIPEPDVPDEPEPEPEPQPEHIPVNDGMDSQPTSDQPFEIRAWPPVDGATSRSQHGEMSKRPSSNMWPPPQAQDYLRSVKDLPSNIKIHTKTEDVYDKSEMEDKTCVKKEPNTDAPTITISEHDELGTIAAGGTHSTRTSTVGTADGRSNNGGGQSIGHTGTDVKIGDENLEQHAGIDSQLVTDQDGNNRKRKHSELEDVANVKRTSTDEHHLSNDQSQSNSTDSPRQNTGFRQYVRRPPVIKDDPLWSYMATDYTYDDLGSGVALGVLDALTLQDGAVDSDVGRWGEALVAQYLQHQKELGSIFDYRWTNNEEETGYPFDFEVLLTEDGYNKDYIEVKSTISDDKEVFEISAQQIKFADEKKNFYHIYRVFNAGDSERMRLIRITDLDMRLTTKQVKLCMLI